MQFSLLLYKNIPLLLNFKKISTSRKLQNFIIAAININYNEYKDNFTTVRLTFFSTGSIANFPDKE